METIEAGVEPPRWATRLHLGGAAGPLWVLGGVAMVVAGLFKWLIIRLPATFGQQPVRISRMDVNDGRLAMGAGAAVVLLTLLLWIARPAGWRLLAAAVAVLAGAMALTVVVTLTFRTSELVNGGDRVTTALGIWIAVGGGGLMVLAGATDLVLRSRAEPSRASGGVSLGGPRPWR